MTPRDDLARFLAEFVSELGGAVTLTVHDEGWDLEPVNASASPVSIRGLQPDLGDLSIRFGHLGRVEFWRGEEMEDALERVKLHVRGVAAGGLTETRRGRDDSRWRGSRWTLELPDGEVRRGFVNWFPWSWGAEEHFGPWDQRAGRVPTDEAGEVDGALRSRLDRWFSTVDLDDERIAPTVEEALRQLVRMLDALAPTRVDRDRSAILSHSYGWTPQTIGIYVAHDNDQHDGLLIELADTNAVVKWLGHHEHVVPAQGDDARPWTTVVVDVVAAAMMGAYEVEVHYRGDHVVKTRLVDVAVAGQERDLGSTGLLFGWLRRGPIRVERKRLDFGIGARPGIGAFRRRVGRPRRTRSRRSSI